MTPFAIGATGAAMLAASAAQAHDQYLGWQHHKTGVSCCTGLGHSPIGDCQPVKLCDYDRGFLEPGTGRCIQIQDHAVTKPLPSMSQEPHACWRDGGTRQFCVSRGPET
jgi:hypothetical protein